MESGWNVWVWLSGGGCGWQEAGVASRWNVWVWLSGGRCGWQEAVWLAGGMYGCRYQEVSVVGIYWCG